MAGCQQGGQSVACRLGIASCAALKCINLELKIVSRDSLFLIQPSLFKPAIQTAVMEGMTAMEPQAHSNRQSFETIRYTTNAMESAIGVRSMFKDSNMSKQVTVVRSSAFCSQAHLGKVKMIQNSSNPQALPDRSGHCRFPLFPPVSIFQSKFCIALPRFQGKYHRCYLVALVGCPLAFVQVVPVSSCVHAAFWNRV